MAIPLPSRLTTRPAPRADWRDRLPHVTFPRVEIPRLEAPRVELPALRSLPLPLRPRRKQRPIDRLTALVSRQVVRPTSRWWGSRSRAQRISTVALGVSGSAALLGAAVWGGSRLAGRRQARLAALPTPAVLPESAEVTGPVAEEAPATEPATQPANTPAR
jgi:hypothetical protein